MLLVVAAGNDSQNIDKDPVYPAAYGESNILTVAASTATDTLASFSNFGSTAVDVARPRRSDLLDVSRRGLQVPLGHLGGLALRCRRGGSAEEQESDATYGDLRYAVRRKVDTPPALNGKVAYGRLNAEQALAAIGSLVD